MRFGTTHSQKTIEKISNAKSGILFTEEHSNKIRMALSGKPKSEEHRRKISEAMNKRNKGTIALQLQPLLQIRQGENKMKNTLYKVIGQGFTANSSIIEMEVGEWVKLHPYKAQVNADGTPRIREPRVNKLTKHIHAALRNEKNPLSLTSDFKIDQGNHRKEAALRSIENGTLDPHTKIRVTLQAPKTAFQIDQEAFLANHGNASENWKGQAINCEHPLYKQVIKPVYDVLNKGMKESFNKSVLDNYAIKLGAFFHENPSSISRIEIPLHISVFGYDMYNLKGDSSGSKEFYSEILPSDVKVDLRPYTQQLTKLLAPMFEVVGILRNGKNESLWSTYLKNKKTLLYMLTAASLRGSLVSGGKAKGNSVSVQQVVRNFRTNATKISRFVTEFSGNNGQNAEAKLLELLGLKF